MDSSTINVPFWEKEICALFADGGLVGRNPSPVAGTWAWCGVARDGDHVREVSGYLFPRNEPCPGAKIESDVVTNNDCEFYAVMRALEAMKDGWSGTLVTDSEITISRLEKCRGSERPRVFRIDWYNRVHRAFERLGTVRVRHIKGHQGNSSTQNGVRHQQWCDDACTERAKKLQEHIDGWIQAGFVSPKEAAA